MTGGQWSSSFAVQLQGVNQASGNPTPVKVNPSDFCQQVMGFGTGVDQVDTIVLQQRTLGAGVSENIDLYDGTTPTPQVVDITNFPIALRHLKAIAIWIKSGGDSSGVTIGGAASDPHTLWWGGTTPTQTIFPNANPMSQGNDNGIAVTTSARYIKILNNGAVAVTYSLAIGGNST